MKLEIRPHDAVSLFLTQKRAEGIRPTTIASYSRSLDMFLAVPGLPDDVRDLEAHHAIAWTAQLAGRSLKPGAINAYQRPVWVWFRWLHNNGYLEVDIPRRVKRFKVTAPTRRTATVEIRSALIECALARKEQALRDAALVEVLWSTGARRTELSLVLLEDLDLEAGTLWLEHTKTGVPRLVGIGMQARLAVERYLVKERGRKPGPLFLARGGVAMSSNAIRCVLRSLAASAGVEVASHDFRRGCAARMRAQGADIAHVMRQLGHSSPVMTLLYSEQGETEAAIKAFHAADQGIRRIQPDTWRQRRAQ